MDFNFTKWLSEYCKANKVKAMAIEGTTRALFLSPVRARYESVGEWLDSANIGPVSKPQLAALASLWEAMTPPKKVKKAKPSAVVVEAEVDPLSASGSIDDDKAQM